MKKITKAGLLGLLSATLVLSMAGCGKKADNSKAFNKDAIYKEVPINVELPKNFDAYSFYLAGDSVFFTGNVYDRDTFESHSYLGRIGLDGSNLRLKENNDFSWYEEVIATPEGNVIGLRYKYDDSGMSYEDSEGEVSIMPYSEPETSDESEDANDQEEVSDVAEDDATTEDEITDVNEDIGAFEEYVGYGESSYVFDVYDKDNNLIKTVSLMNDLGVDYLMNFIPMEDMFIATGSDEQLYYINYDLEVVNKAKADSGEDYGRIYRVKDGSYVTRVWEESGSSFYTIDVKTLKKGSKIDVPFYLGIYSIYEGKAAGYDLLLSDNVSYYGYNLGDAEPKEIFNLINSDIAENNFRFFEAVGDNTFLGIYTDYEGDSPQTYFSNYVKVKPEDVKEKEIIVLGCIWADSDVKRDVVKFNKSRDDVRIAIVDYNEYSTDEDYMAGYKKFNSDIASGNGPDIMLSSFDEKFTSYAKKGLFVDLNTMFDKDTEINKEDYCENVLNLLSENGKLYFLTDSFAVRTVMGKKSVLGDRKSWTLDEMIQFEKTLPENSKLFFTNTRENFLQNVIAANYKFYIDSANGKCNFNNEEFIKLLEYCKNLPEGNEDYYNEIYSEDYYQNYETMFRTNSTILNEYYFSDTDDLSYMIYGRFGEPVTFIGYPCNEGNGSGLYFNRVFAISSKSRNKDASWEFIKTKISKESQDDLSWYFPVLRTALDAKFESATKPRTYINYETGEEEVIENTYYVGGVEITIDPLSKEEADAIENFVLSIDKRSSYIDENINNIVTEEVAPFYNNQKSAQDVANIIQSRVSIMMAEQQ